MTVFDVAATLIAVAAVSGYVNHRLLRLPPTSGTLLVALVSSLVVVVIEQIVPGAQLRPTVERFVNQIDFGRTLMHGLLCFLLFAGALHVDLEGLVNHRWTIAALSTIWSVAVGRGGWPALVFDLIGLHQRLLVCLTFGALISPTDPIAVMGCSTSRCRSQRCGPAAPCAEGWFRSRRGAACAADINRLGYWPCRGFSGKEILLACTYAVVAFFVLVHGLTVRRVLVYYRVGDDAMG